MNEPAVATPPAESATSAAPVSQEPAHDPRAIFRAEMEKVAEKPVEAAPIEAPKAEVPKEAAKVVEKDGDIPEQFLGGKKAEPVKADGKVDEIDAVVNAEPPPNLSQKAKVDWNKQREVVKLVHEQNRLLKEKLSNAEKAPKTDETTATELKAEREKRAQLEQLLERTAFEHSPRFKEFSARETRALDAAKAYLEGTEVNPNVIELAARAAGAKRSAILKEAGMDAEAIALIAPHLAEIDRTQYDKSQALDNYKQTSAQWESEQKAKVTQEEARQKQEDDSVFSKTLAEFAPKLTAFQKVEGHERWNSQGEALAQQAKEYFNGNVPLEEAAKVVLKGFAYDVEAKLNQTLRDKLTEVIAERDRLKAAQPSIGDAREDGKKPVETGNWHNDATARFNEEMKRAGAAA